MLGTGATVLDSRAPTAFDAGHVAGSINLPVSSPGVGTRAGWALDPEVPVVIVAADAADAGRMALALQAVGFWNLVGVSIADAEDWAAPLSAGGSRRTPGISSSSPTACAGSPSISSTSASPASGCPATSPAHTTCR